MRPWVADETFRPEEIGIFLCENLESAEIIIDGMNNWESVLNKGGEWLIRQLQNAHLDLTKLYENRKMILHATVEQNNEQVAQLLWSLGFNMKVTETTCKTALDITTKEGWPACRTSCGKC